MAMYSHSLKVLEYDRIVSKLRERTASALGDTIAIALKPSTSFFEVSEWQRETSEARRMIQEEGGIPLGGIHDIRSHIGRARREGLLQPSDFLEIGGTLASGRRLRAFVLKRSEDFPKLAEIAVNIKQFPRIEESIESCITEGGDVCDTASSELARIRSKKRTTHSRLIEKLQAVIHSSEFRPMIQDPLITQRGGRYCIPIKSDHRGHFPGVVHDSSASGATVFIEPVSVVDLGNELVELMIQEEREVEKILRWLTGLIKSAGDDIEVTLDALGRLDFASAKAKLSLDMDANEPELNQDGRIRLLKARHPLLEGEVVPIDVELGRTFTVLLITGPNTGGKTVTLKTIGLLALMAQSGLHIPALSGSEIAIFQDIYADIGDEQSIQQSLSTFSSHMKNIVALMDDAGKDSLVLLDEIGAGTDPAEGAALAKAILDELLCREARVAASTHYGELKEFAFERDGIQNASVEFDVETLRPAYTLRIGVPGSSNAFAIASRLGLPDGIVQAARKMVRGGEASEEIIRKIEQTHRAVAEKEQIAERVSRDAEALKSRYERQIEELESLRRDLRRQLTEEVDRRIRERLENLDSVIAELKSMSGVPRKELQQSRERVKREVKEIREEVEEILPELPEEEPEGPFVLKAGDTVRIPVLGVQGELLNSPSDGEAHVMVGSKKISVPWEVVRPSCKVGRRTAQESSDSSYQIASAKIKNVAPELKIIAQRVEEALLNLDKYLDDAQLAGLTSVRIIHGKGTGALRKAVWEFLENHNAVESFRLGTPEEGGAGATVVKLKE